MSDGTPILSASVALEAIFDLVKLPNAPVPRLPDGSINPSRVVPRVVELNTAYQQVLQQRDAFRARVAELGGDAGASDYSLPELPERAPQVDPAPQPTPCVHPSRAEAQCEAFREILHEFVAMGDKLYPSMDQFLCTRLEASMDREAELIHENQELKCALQSSTLKDPQ